MILQVHVQCKLILLLLLSAAVDISANSYWRTPFSALCQFHHMTKFLVLQCEPLETPPSHLHINGKVVFYTHTHTHTHIHTHTQTHTRTHTHTHTHDHLCAVTCIHVQCYCITCTQCSLNFTSVFILLSITILLVYQNYNVD